MSIALRPYLHFVNIVALNMLLEVIATVSQIQHENQDNDAARKAQNLLSVNVRSEKRNVGFLNEIQHNAAEHGEYYADDAGISGINGEIFRAVAVRHRAVQNRRHAYSPNAGANEVKNLIYYENHARKVARTAQNDGKITQSRNDGADANDEHIRDFIGEFARIGEHDNANHLAQKRDTVNEGILEAEVGNVVDIQESCRGIIGDEPENVNENDFAKIRVAKRFGKHLEHILRLFVLCVAAGEATDGFVTVVEVDVALFGLHTHIEENDIYNRQDENHNADYHKSAALVALCGVIVENAGADQRKHAARHHAQGISYADKLALIGRGDKRIQPCATARVDELEQKLCDYVQHEEQHRAHAGGHIEKRHENQNGINQSSHKATQNSGELDFADTVGNLNHQKCCQRSNDRRIGENAVERVAHAQFQKKRRDERARHERRNRRRRRGAHKVADAAYLPVAFGFGVLHEKMTSEFAQNEKQVILDVFHN